MFRSKELATWLQAEGITASFEFDGRDLSQVEQDIVVVLTMTGGPPGILERTFDNPTVQVISRGGQFDPDSTEDLAGSIDDALLAPTSTLIGDSRVIGIDRVGGPPGLLNRDSANRSVFVCNYVFTVARTAF